MIRELTIENFRGFKSFKMHELGRVNLLVGSNGSGKTSVLEALHLLNSPGDLHAFGWIGSQRGELGDDPQTGSIDFSHLFYGHEVKCATPITLTCRNDCVDLRLTVTATPDEKSPSGEALKLDWNGTAKQGPTWSLPVSANGYAMIASNALKWSESLSRSRSLFVTGASLTEREAIELFKDVALDPFKERLLLDALKAIRPQIERVAPKHGGFHVRLEGHPEAIPIGLLGDGVRRMLSVALALAHQNGNVLLIDEIDTGLHYSVMEKMWRLINEASEKLKVQVFASTHSRDCVEALAAICQETDAEASDVTIHRTVQDRLESVVYTEGMIIAAAERGIEVR